MPTWTQATPASAGVRPGTYINFAAAALENIAPGALGVVAVAGIQNWGPDGDVQSLASLAEAKALFQDTDDATSTLYRMVREAFLGGANRVLAYRMMGASGAAKSVRTLQDTTGSPVNVIRLNSKYYGTYGNAFKVSVADNISDATLTDIKLYNGSTLLRTWTSTVAQGDSGYIDDLVAQINADTGNIWITATKLAAGNETLADLSSTSFSSGNDGASITSTEKLAMLANMQVLPSSPSAQGRAPQPPKTVSMVENR